MCLAGVGASVCLPGGSHGTSRIGVRVRARGSCNVRCRLLRQRRARSRRRRWRAVGAYAWQSGFATPGFNEMIVSELHVGSFATTGGVGTWRAATARLDYPAGLGVNMIELTPVAEFPGDVSWGYNPAEPLAPESAYG